MRDRTTAAYGTAEKIGETKWVEKYVKVRREWLATHPNTLLRKTAYRMESFAKLIQEARWSLELPLSIRGVLITEELLTVTPVRISAESEEERILKLQTPYLIGDDVRAVQQALVARGFEGKVDGIYGPLTEARIRQFQTQNGLRPDGIVGPATRAALGL
jgi:chitosanase